MPNQFREKLVLFVLAILIIADQVTGLLFNLEFDYYRIGLIVKSIILATIFIYYFKYLPRPTFRSLYYTIGILFVCWALASSISLLHNLQFSIGYSFIVLFRYLFFFLVALMFFDLNSNEKFIHGCKKVLEIFFIINNAFIFIGFIFHIDFLSTYDPLGYFTDERFGYKGLIHGGNDVAGIYIIGSAYFFRQALRYRESKNLLLIATCLAGLLTGTKATFIGITAISAYYLIRYRPQLFISLVLPIFFVIGGYVSSHWSEIKEKYLQALYERFYTMDLLTFLMTGRNDFIKNNFVFMLDNWQVVNFIVGDAFLYSETDLLDLYFFFGLAALLYLYVYFKVLFMFDKSPDHYFVMMIFLVIASFGGHMIQSATVPVFLLLFIFTYTPSNAESGYRRNYQLQ
jgi:hypothetical protein